MRLPQRSSKAFTLIELIVVIVILGILALIAIPTFGKVIAKSQDESTLSSLRAMARNAQALKAMDQAAAWSTIPADSIGEVNVASSAGVQAARLAAVVDDGSKNPLAGQVTYFVKDDGVVLSMLSGSKKICVVGFDSATMGKGLCQAPAAGATTSLGSSLSSGAGSVLPPATTSSGGTGSGAPAVTGASVKYSQYGTGVDDVAYAVTVGADNTVYAGGYSNGAFPGYPAPVTGQALVVAQNPDGTQKWVSEFGANTSGATSFVYGLAATSSTLYAVGSVGGSVFSSSNGANDAFLVAYNMDGSMKWKTQFGSSVNEVARSVAVGSDGTVYVAGNTYGALSGANKGSGDLFIAAYSPTGSQKWISQYGTNQNELVLGLALDANDNLYVGGATLGSFGGTWSGDYDAYLASYAKDGSSRWTKQWGSSDGGNDNVSSVASTPSGGIVVSGTTGGNLYVPNIGGGDAYVTTFDAAGTQGWKSQFGSTSTDTAPGLAVGSDGTVYVAGTTYGNLEKTSLGGADQYIAAYSSTGAAKFTKQFGSSLNDIANAASVAPSGSLFLVGNTTGGLNGNNRGATDLLITQVD